MSDDFPELRLLIERLDGKMDRISDKVDNVSSRVGNISSELAKYETRIAALDLKIQNEGTAWRDRTHELANMIQPMLGHEKLIRAVEERADKLETDMAIRQGAAANAKLFWGAIGAVVTGLITVAVKLIGTI